MESEQSVSLAVAASRLDKARNSLSPDTGGSKYTFSEKAIQQLPQGANTPLNQVILQAPGVAQDSFGQLHVRGDHANLQFRINGIQLPEGITGFGQVLSPRFARSVSLLTGTLPAEYGLRTAGVIDIKTKDGLLDPVQSVEFYGGQRGTTQPSFEYGGSKGNFSYFVTGQYLGSDRGVEPPTLGSDCDSRHQQSGLGLRILLVLSESSTRLSLVTAPRSITFKFLRILISRRFSRWQECRSIPPRKSARTRPSRTISTCSRCKAWLDRISTTRSRRFSRYSTVSFNPDHVGDLIYNGAAGRIFSQRLWQRCSGRHRIPSNPQPYDSHRRILRFRTRRD